MGMISRPPSSFVTEQGQPLDKYYYIDAWHAGDGALFASLRTPRIDVWDEFEGQEVETYLLRAPDFDAMPVSRALAYGAVRRGSQEGFSLDGIQEIAFSTLAQVRELARRAYIASAIGEGGPEGDAPPVQGQPPPDGGPSSLHSDPRRELYQEWEKELADAVAELSLGSASAAGEPSRQRLREVIRNALDNEFLEDASRLLLASADRALEIKLAEYASVPIARSLVYLASCLVGAESLYSISRTIPLHDNAKIVVDLMLGHPLHELGNVGQGDRGLEAMRLLCSGLLPEYQIRDTQNLPPRCLMWIDVLEYLSTDRQYFLLGRDGAWMPLAIAVASIATAPRLPLEPWFGWKANGKSIYRSAWLDRIADLIASIIPAGGLPSNVESWIRDRCWSYQRNGVQSSTS